VALLVARAEWAARGGAATAEGLYRQALAQAEARGVPAEIALAAQAYGAWLLAAARVDDTADLAGRVARWADRDFDCALFEASVLKARGGKAWTDALRQARALAGERPIPAALADPAA
jgi:hypothetical protein